MKLYFSIFFLLITIFVKAQTFPKKYVDSLTTIALSKKSNHPLILNRDSVLQLLWKEPAPAKRIAMFYDIVAYSDELTPKQSLYYHQLILDRAQKSGDKVLEAVVMAELGFIISRNGNTPAGLKMLYKSLELAEGTDNAQAIGIAYNNLGLCYPNNLKIKRDYMTKSLEYALKGKDYLFASFDLDNLGDMFMREQKRDSALAYYLKSYRLAVDKNLEGSIPEALLALSDLDDKENTLQYYRQASRMPYAIRNSELRSMIASRKATYFLQLNRMDSAFYYATEVYNLAATAHLTRQMNALGLMLRYYRAVPNTDSTLSYLERYYNLKDSLYGDKVVEQAQSMAYSDMQRQKQLIAQKAAFQNRIILYALSAAALFLIGLAFIFWRNKRKEEQAKKVVQQQKDELEQILDKLKSTQTQLIQSEKMASLGELTAGIAHEIQNPLNFVNNFSEVNKEMLEELKAERLKPKADRDEAMEDEIIGDVIANEEKISHHGKRADAIVKGMLQHSRSSSGQKEPTDINALADEYLRLAYHGLRAKDKSLNANFETDFDASIGKINIVPQDIGRVIMNLVTNAFYAVNEKKITPQPPEDGIQYEPKVTVITKSVKSHSGDLGVLISVTDNGNGIPDAAKEKIFQPFFTTKPSGKGTGLGLSLSYDIIKAHGGEINVETKEGEGSTFVIQLPIV